MERVTRVPLLISFILPFIYLDSVQASLAILSSIPLMVFFTYVKKRVSIASWFFVLLSLITFIILYYFFAWLTWFEYTLFIFVNFVDWTLATMLLPFMILTISQAGIVSPLLGSYPSPVKIGNHDIASVILPSIYVALIGGKASAIGFSIPYLIALASFAFANLMPNPIMIKLSTPLFVAIFTGITLNIARVKLRKVVRRE